MGRSGTVSLRPCLPDRNKEGCRRGQTARTRNAMVPYHGARGFDSLSFRHLPVAQWTERWPPKPEVARSIRAGQTTPPRCSSDGPERRTTNPEAARSSRASEARLSKPVTRPRHPGNVALRAVLQSVCTARTSPNRRVLPQLRMTARDKWNPMLARKSQDVLRDKAVRTRKVGRAANAADC